MNNTLGEINIRITKTERQINDLEDRMVEITATEHNIEKIIKKIKSETSGTTLNVPTFT